MVAIDETFLSLLVHPKALARRDPLGQPIDHLSARIEELIDRWQEDNETVILPTPALSEFLILAGKDGPHYLNKLKTFAFFKVRPFDEMAAIELAAMQLSIRALGGKRGAQEGTWAKGKFDRQIVAIAKVNNATAIFCDDDGLANSRRGMESVQFALGNYRSRDGNRMRCHTRKRRPSTLTRLILKEPPVDPMTLEPSLKAEKKDQRPKAQRTKQTPRRMAG